MGRLVRVDQGGLSDRLSPLDRARPSDLQLLGDRPPLSDLLGGVLPHSSLQWKSRLWPKCYDSLTCCEKYACGSVEPIRNCRF